MPLSPNENPIAAYSEGRGAEQNNPHFSSMDHEMFAGLLNGLIASHKADLGAVRAYPEKDGAGIYKPIIVVEMQNGATFRLVVAEV